MGRPKRAHEAGGIYHMLNRATRRATNFHKGADYEAFENVLATKPWFVELQAKGNDELENGLGIYVRGLPITGLKLTLQPMRRLIRSPTGSGFPGNRPIYAC